MTRPLVATLALWICACGGAAPRSETPAPLAMPSAPTFVESSITAVHGAFVASMDVAVTSFGAAVTSEGHLYVAGGYFGTPHEYDREGQSAALGHLGANGAWEARARMETGLQGFAMVPIEGGLLRCGGSRIDNAHGTAADMHSIATCMRYVEADDRWEPFTDMPLPRSSFDAAALDGRVYAIGGWSLDGDATHGVFTDAMVIFDTSTRTWSSEPCPVTRRALAVVATTHAVIAIGGLDASLSASSAVDVYDPSTHAWSHGPEFPGDGFGVAAAAIGDAVYASGSAGTLWRWSPGETAWTSLASLAQPRFFHRLVPLGTDLYAIGGIGSMTMDGRARLIETISTTTPNAPAIGWADITFPGRARNRFGMFAAEDSIYVIGGNDSPEQHDFAETNFVAEAFRLHVPSLRWFPLAPLPEARQSLESIPVGQEVIAIGGFGHDGHTARTFADRFVMRDGEHFEMARDALPTGRTQFGATFHDDAIWIFAGLIFDESLPEAQQFTHLDDVLRCPVESGVMRACETISAHLPGTRRAFASAASGDHMYIVGGMREGFAPIDDCADFDFAARTFSSMPCPAHVRISGAMLEHDGMLYLCGGSARDASGSLAADRSIEVFDPATQAWSTLIAELPFDTHQARWAFVGDRVVMLRTQDAAGHATLAIVDACGATRPCRRAAPASADRAIPRAR